MEIVKAQVQWMGEFSQKIIASAALLSPKEFAFQINEEEILFKFKEQELQRVHLRDINKIEVCKEEYKRWIISCGQQNNEISLPMDAEIEGHSQMMDMFISLPDFDSFAFIEFESSDDFNPTRKLVFCKFT